MLNDFNLGSLFQRLSNPSFSFISLKALILLYYLEVKKIILNAFLQSLTVYGAQKLYVKLLQCKTSFNRFLF